MAINKEVKEKLIKEFGKSPNDTGSIELQIALLTEDIKQLTEHLRENKKDFSSKHGMLSKVSRRRSFLKYIERVSFAKYQELIGKLGLKR